MSDSPFHATDLIDKIGMGDILWKLVASEYFSKGSFDALGGVKVEFVSFKVDL
jgi:hypothetical protein